MLDIAAPPELIDTSDGRHLVIVAGKDGYLYALDRDTLRLLYKTRVTIIQNADAPLKPQGTHYCPGIDGGVEWNGPAYSPQTNAFYGNAIDWCITVATRPPAQLEGRKGLPWTGAKDRLHPFGVPDKEHSGWVTAVNATDGSVPWRYHAPHRWFPALLPRPAAASSPVTLPGTSWPWMRAGPARAARPRSQRRERPSPPPSRRRKPSCGASSAACEQRTAWISLTTSAAPCAGAWPCARSKSSTTTSRCSRTIRPRRPRSTRIF